ncbi:MAG: ABC transporter permease [Verrucomicrobiota bacterium]
MRVFFILLLKELRSYFTSFIAYVVMALVMLLNGLTFSYALSKLRETSSRWSLIHWSFNGIGFWLVFILIIPLITMRLFAEEQKLGTLEPLLTAPVRTSQVVLAKYFSALLFYMIVYLPCMLNFLIFEWISGESAGFNQAAFFGSYTLLLLMGMMFIGVGCLASALTENQIIAAIISFTVLVIYFLLGFVNMVGYNLPEMTVQFLSYLSSIEHMRVFCSGEFDIRPIILYLSVAGLMVVLTYHVLEYRKWKI